MYKILVFFLFLSLGASAQKVRLNVSTPLATNVYRGPLGSDSALYIGAGCGEPTPIVNLHGFYGIYRGALIYKDTCNDNVYTSNPDETWTLLGSNSYTIDTIFNLSGTTLLLTIPHSNGSTPTDVRVQVDNEAGLTTFVDPYFDGTNVYISYSIGPICNCEYLIRIYR